MKSRVVGAFMVLSLERFRSESDVGGDVLLWPEHSLLNGKKPDGRGVWTTGRSMSH
jgi:hypothetical protein